ncbi:MAG: MFS transporter [Sporichthyaceae bacterium]|nr:MFS transporter [Sporichthyaceae bacterium]
MTTQQSAPQGQGAAQHGRHPGIALAVICAAQLMIVLDATIVNVALPSMQTDLNLSATGLSWVLNAYTLTFGGLLLLGGRAGDILGRRRVFMVGIVLFALASLLGGLAQEPWQLFAARALQGIGGAIASPTALSLITTNFEEGPERNRAFGLFAAVSSAGAAIGLIAGGMLTEWLSWRWTLFVNVPIAIAVALMAPLYIRESERHTGRFDIAGALTSTIGMGALVYGFISAADRGWSDSITLLSFVTAVVLLLGFLMIERGSAQPITPLHLFRNRDRTASYLVMLLFAAAMFGMFFFLTQFVQNVLDYSPLKAGMAFLPITVAIAVTAGMSAKLLPQYGPKLFMVVGGVLATTGLIWLAMIDANSGYVGGLLSPTVLFGLGMGFVFMPVTVLALSGVENQESGAASGLLQVMQMVGGTIGLAVLTTVFGTALRNEITERMPEIAANATPEQLAQFQQTEQLSALPAPFGDQILAHGIGRSLWLAAGLAVLALLITVIGIRATKSDIDMATLPGAPAGG